MEQKPTLNIMVDLETASTRENAAILSWAMVPFLTEGDFNETNAFYASVSLTSCFLSGMDFDKDTQQWWMDQDAKARGCILHAKEQTSIHSASESAFAWLESLAGKYDLYIWSRGLDFDIPKMEWCFRKFVERPIPYKYSHKMDVRTVLKLMQVDQDRFEFSGIRHNALDDCKHDIAMIREAFRAYDRLKEAASLYHVQEAARNLSETRHKAE